MLPNATLDRRAAGLLRAFDLLDYFYRLETANDGQPTTPATDGAGMAACAVAQPTTPTELPPCTP